MRTRLRLFLDWGITFDTPYLLPDRAARPVRYAGAGELEKSIALETRRSGFYPPMARRDGMEGAAHQDMAAWERRRSAEKAVRNLAENEVSRGHP